MARTLKIAVIGQSAFATDVYRLVKKNGHTVVGVFTIPDKNGREVTLAVILYGYFTISRTPSLLPPQLTAFRCSSSSRGG